MVIIDNKERKTTFYDISTGEVFRSYGELFLKCIPWYDKEDDCYRNCVNLQTGEIDYLDEYSECSVVNAKLIIE